MDIGQDSAGPVRFKELSYADERDPRLKRWLIRFVEGLSGRGRHVCAYETWRSDVLGKSGGVFTRLLDLVDVTLDVKGNWPGVSIPEGPIVIVANHPFGVGDGIALLAIAEQIGRPFKVLIHSGLLKVPEIRPYALPIAFEETKQAVATNLQTRREAVRLLKEGTTIVIFPAGGVATAKKVFHPAEDLPWKIFTTKLVQEAHAGVLPVYFEGQNGRLFHLASKVSMTLRLSLLIGEFCRLSGNTITAHVGKVLPWETLAMSSDRKDLLVRLRHAVFAMAPGAERLDATFEGSVQIP